MKSALRTIVAGLAGTLIISACAGVGEREDRSTPLRPGSSAASNACPVTVPSHPGFVPPEPYPPEAPSEQVWYGSPELWTLLDRNGSVWRGLPVGADGSIGDKTAWFSEAFSKSEGEDFSGDPTITVTAVRLDGSAPTVIQEGGQPSFNRGIKNFLLVPLVLPEPGCWEVTARYRDVELAYVLHAKG